MSNCSALEWTKINEGTCSLIASIGQFHFYQGVASAENLDYMVWQITKKGTQVYVGTDLTEALATWREVLAIVSDGGVEVLVDKFQKQIEEQAAFFRQMEEAREQEDATPDLFMPEPPKFTLN